MGRPKIYPTPPPRKIYDARYRAKRPEAARKATRDWYFRTREIRLALRKEYVRKVKDEVIEHYGGACKCCGERERVFLAVDHINNDGAKHRRENRALVGYGFYLWLRKNNFPDTFQLLCQNCNWAKYVLGVCPHERAKLSAKSPAA